MLGTVNIGEINTNFGLSINTYLDNLRGIVEMLDKKQIQKVIEKIIEAYQNDRFIYVFGNGGSASTASHFVSDFNKGVSQNLHKKFRFLCLNDNIPLMMAISNDINYNHVFDFQLQNYLVKDDLVIAISGSGNSKNVINAVKYANSQGAYTIGLTGFDGGELLKISKYGIHVPSYEMQLVEDIHLILNHTMMSIIKNHLENGIK